MSFLKASPLEGRVFFTLSGLYGGLTSLSPPHAAGAWYITCAFVLDSLHLDPDGPSQVHKSGTLARTDDTSLATSRCNPYSLFVIRWCACERVARVFQVACARHTHDCDIHCHGWLHIIIPDLRHLLSAALHPRTSGRRFNPDCLPSPWPNWPSRVLCHPHWSKLERDIVSRIFSKFFVHFLSVALHESSFIRTLHSYCILVMDFGDHVLIFCSPRHRIDIAEDAYRVYAQFLGVSFSKRELIITTRSVTFSRPVTERLCNPYYHSRQFTRRRILSSIWGNLRRRNVPFVAIHNT